MPLCVIHIRNVFGLRLREGLRVSVCKVGKVGGAGRGVLSVESYAVRLNQTSARVTRRAANSIKIWKRFDLVKRHSCALNEKAVQLATGSCNRMARRSGTSLSDRPVALFSPQNQPANRRGQSDVFHIFDFTFGF